MSHLLKSPPFKEHSAEGLQVLCCCSQPTTFEGLPNRMAHHRGRQIFLPDFWPRDRSQRLRNRRSVHLSGFLRPSDHSQPISSHFGDFGPDPLSETSTSVLSQQQTSVLFQQQTSVLSQQQTSVLSQQKTSILSQQKTQQLPASGQQLPHFLLRQDGGLLLR